MEYPYWPKRVLFEQEALKYPLGKEIEQLMRGKGVPIQIIGSHNRVTGIPGKTAREQYVEGKNTLVVGVRRGNEFQTCKPSAHYQLPLCTSCAGMCEYCYLNTTLGKKPYLRVYVNTEDILQRAKGYIEQRKPEITIFEGSATSDPLPTEPFTNNLAKAIEFFGQEEYGRFRFVTKFTNVESFVGLNHQGKTTIRFTINTNQVIERYEHRTPRAAERINALTTVAKAGYPVGVMIGPIFYYSGYQEDYRQLFLQLANQLKGIEAKLSIELISHRFTTRAKNQILEVFPETLLPLNPDERQYKYGQFGYGKYIYPKEVMEEMKSFFQQEIQERFPYAEMKYFV